MNISFIWLQKDDEDKSEMYSADIVKNYAIFNNNQVLYKEYERHLHEIENDNDFDKINIPFLFLLIINSLLAAFYKQGFMLPIYNFLIQKNIFARLLFIPLGFYIMALLSHLLRNRNSEKYIYIEDKQIGETLKEYQKKSRGY